MQLMTHVDTGIELPPSLFSLSELRYGVEEIKREVAAIIASVKKGS